MKAKPSFKKIIANTGSEDSCHQNKYSDDVNSTDKDKSDYNPTNNTVD